MGREPADSRTATAANGESAAHEIARELGDEGEEEELSKAVPLASAPPEIIRPQESKPTYLAKSRYRIAQASIGLLAFVVVAAFVDVWLGRSIDDLSRLLDIIFAPVIALVAAAVAFYYRGSSL